MSPSQHLHEILIVEDNRGDMLLVREALDRRGFPYTAQMATDGGQAIALIERLDSDSSLRLDLIIMDMHLPKYDGLAILERLRATTHFRTTPVIALSGLPADWILNATRSYGPVQPFAKPTDLKSFMSIGALAESLLKPGLNPPGQHQSAASETSE